jgi:hypothetical protein
MSDQNKLSGWSNRVQEIVRGYPRPKCKSTENRPVVDDMTDVTGMTDGRVIRHSFQDDRPSLPKGVGFSLKRGGVRPERGGVKELSSAPLPSPMLVCFPAQSAPRMTVGRAVTSVMSAKSG